jgi:hypothetical protein
MCDLGLSSRLHGRKINDLSSYTLKYTVQYREDKWTYFSTVSYPQLPHYTLRHSKDSRNGNEETTNKVL